MNQRKRSVAAAVARFGTAGLLALVALGGLMLTAISRISTSEALDSARERARLAGYGVVEPSIDSALTTLGPEREDALRALDEIVQTRILSERVVRVKIWTATGLILYSDQPELIGLQFPTKDDHQTVLRTGGIEAEEVDTDQPENRFERDNGRLLEVYLPIRSPDGTPLVYEQYERYDSVTANSRRLLRRLVLPLAIGLGLLWLIQLPLAASLARRMRRAEAERASMLEQAVTASTRERERIAADLHDGAVQDLAGLTFELEASAARAPAGASRDELARAAGIARHTMQELRATLVDLHPPTVATLGLANGFEAAAEPLRATGAEVRVDVNLPDLDADIEALLYRVGHELLLNVAEHADANSVIITATANKSVARLTVTDDGKGFTDVERSDRRTEGHMGLELQEALVRQAGGSLTVSSSPGTGTVAVVEVPR
jgi:two-component system, NarL family, sensor kinase